MVTPNWKTPFSTQRPLPRSQNIELLLEQGGLHEHPAVKMALAMSAVTGQTDTLDTFARLALLRSASSDEKHPFNSPDTSALPGTGLRMGRVVFADGSLGSEIYSPTETFSRHPHILVSGASGTGKSFHMMGLASCIISSGESVWFFDSEGDFVNLMPRFGTDKLWVIRYDQFRRNPMEPLPGERPLLTLGRLKTVLREACFMREGSVNLMSELVHKLYSERGVFSGSEDYPCLEDIYLEVKRGRFRLDSRRGQYAEVLMSRLGNIIDNMGDTYRCKKGFPVAEIASHSIVFDIVGLSRDLAHFFLDDLILWLADWKLRELRCGL